MSTSESHVPQEGKQNSSFFQRERQFLLIIGICLIIAGSTYQLPEIARWIGFLLAGYAAIANDSIQTIGTFIASNKHRPWWVLWIFIGGIFLVTMGYSWSNFGGPVDINMSGMPQSSQESTMLRITLSENESSQKSFREIAVQVEDGNIIARESLGMDMRVAYTVQAIEVGTVPAAQCFMDGAWVPKPSDLDKATKKKLCWNGSSLPKGASNPPEFIDVYARGAATSSGVWEMKSEEGSKGTVRVHLEQGGDVSSQRLFAKGFDTTPKQFSFLQIIAPLCLLVLTRLKMPVSTTFLLLTSFATEAKSIGKVMSKSFTGYLLAFVIAMAVWLLLSPQFKKWFKGKPHAMWNVAQWTTTGLLWSVWLMQDAANIAVYLPRQLTLIEFLGFSIPMFLGLGFMFWQGGDRIQQIVDEKSQVVDVRAATVIDFIYAIILFYFKIHSKIPMSTTWVFLGLIGGRELAMNLRNAGDRTVREAFIMMMRDTGAALLGLLISLLIAMACNEAMYDGVMSSLGLR